MTAQASTTEMFCVAMARVTSLQHNIITTSPQHHSVLLHLFLAVVSTVLPMAAPATSTARQLTSPYTPTSCREVSSFPVGTPRVVLSEAGVVQKWVKNGQYIKQERHCK